MTLKLMDNNREDERGFSLVEVSIGLVLLAIVCIGAGQLLRSFVAPMILTERQRRANDQATSLLNELSGRDRNALPTGGSFRTNEDGSPVKDGNYVRLDCTNRYCDQIVAIPQSKTSLFKFVRIDWTDQIPTEAQQVYIRAWSVREADQTRKLRRITVLIFPRESTEPLINRVLDVVQK